MLKEVGDWSLELGVREAFKNKTQIFWIRAKVAGGGSDLTQTQNNLLVWNLWYGEGGFSKKFQTVKF